MAEYMMLANAHDSDAPDIADDDDDKEGGAGLEQENALLREEVRKLRKLLRRSLANRTLHDDAGGPRTLQAPDAQRPPALSESALLQAREPRDCATGECERAQLAVDAAKRAGASDAVHVACVDEPDGGTLAVLRVDVPRSLVLAADRGAELATGIADALGAQRSDVHIVELSELKHLAEEGAPADQRQRRSHDRSYRHRRLAVASRLWDDEPRMHNDGQEYAADIGTGSGASTEQDDDDYTSMNNLEALRGSQSTAARNGGESDKMHLRPTRLRLAGSKAQAKPRHRLAAMQTGGDSSEASDANDSSSDHVIEGAPSSNEANQLRGHSALRTRGYAAPLTRYSDPGTASPASGPLNSSANHFEAAKALKGTRSRRHHFACPVLEELDQPSESQLMELLRTQQENNPLFHMLSPSIIKRVQMRLARYARRVKFASGQSPIVQNQENFYLFYVESGSFHATQNLIEGDGGSVPFIGGKRIVHTISTGGCFGETCLMNAFSLVTLTAAEVSVVVAINRSSIRHTLKTCHQEAIMEVMTFLRKSTPLLWNLKDSELMLVAQSIETVEYEGNKPILSVGDKVNHFYIVRSGCAVLSIPSRHTADGRAVLARYPQGAHFGEQLLKRGEAPRLGADADADLIPPNDRPRSGSREMMQPSESDKRGHGLVAQAELCAAGEGCELLRMTADDFYSLFHAGSKRIDTNRLQWYEPHVSIAGLYRRNPLSYMSQFESGAWWLILLRMAELMRPESHAQNEVVIRQGEDRHIMAWVQSGVAVSKRDISVDFDNGSRGRGTCVRVLGGRRAHVVSRIPDLCREFGLQLLFAPVSVEAAMTAALWSGFTLRRRKPRGAAAVAEGTSVEEKLKENVANKAATDHDALLNVNKSDGDYGEEERFEVVFWCGVHDPSQAGTPADLDADLQRDKEKGTPWHEILRVPDELQTSIRKRLEELQTEYLNPGDVLGATQLFSSEPFEQTITSGQGTGCELLVLDIPTLHDDDVFLDRFSRIVASQEQIDTHQKLRRVDSYFRKEKRKRRSSQQQMHSPSTSSPLRRTLRGSSGGGIHQSASNESICTDNSGESDRELSSTRGLEDTRDQSTLDGVESVLTAAIRESGAVEGGDGNVNLDSADVERHPTLKNIVMLDVIGVGAFAQVHIVQHMETGDLYALKSMSKRVIESQGVQEYISFERQLLSLARSPHIVEYCGSAKDESHVYIFMELMLGGDLFSLLQRERRLDDSTARFYAASLVLALQYLHDRSILYRDLKPENVLIDGKGFPKLADFGFAKRLVGNSLTYSFCGTPDYLAPEIVCNRGHGLAVDYWCLGCTQYQLLTGISPFGGSANEGDRMRSILLAKVDLSRRGLTASSADLLKRLLVSDPNRRANARVVQGHMWFHGTQWERLQNGEVRPPFVPDPRRALEGQYFDPDAVEAAILGGGGSPPPSMHGDGSDPSLPTEQRVGGSGVGDRGAAEGQPKRDVLTDQGVVGWDDEF